MSLNSQERELVLSVKNKIQKYSIPITLKQAFSNSANVFVNTIYNDKSFEAVDAGIEIFLIKNSFAYFLDKYCLVDIPGLGTVPMNPYYFQMELAKEVLDYRKIVVDKTRQCLLEDSFVMTNRGYISVKDVKVGDKIETLVDEVPRFVEVYDSFFNGEKEVCRVSVGSGLEIGCTYDHRVFTQRGWVEAGDLTIEDEILSKSGFIKVKSITPIEGLHKVYDLTTESSDFLANGLLVHNCGVSTVFSLYCLWRANFFPAESIDVISLKQLKAQQFINKMDSTLKNLPPWMKTPLTTDNKQQKIFSHPNGSKSSILSESQSDTAGRSDSLSLLVLDELAHYQSDRMVRGIISASTPALSKTGGQSILISTPNSTVGSGAYYYSQVQAAKQELESSVKYLEIDWWEIPDDLRIKAPKKGYNKVLEEAISKNYYYDRKVKAKYKEFFKPITDNYESNPWLKATYDDLGPITFKQEILHEFVIEGDRVFSEEILNRVKSKTKDPIVKDELWIDGQKIREQKGMWYWKMPEVGGRYAIGVDVSSGTGADTSTIQVLNLETYEQVAEFKGYISTPAFARLVKEVARSFNDGYVIIESNSIGDTIFSNVYYSENDPYGNVFKQKKTKNGITRFTGWLTDVKTRQLMTSEFIDWVTVPELSEQFKINSERLFLEMETWVWKNGKPIHADNCLTGDTVIVCKDGFKKIKDIIVGELVLTETGKFKPVTEVITLDSDRKVVKTIKGAGLPPINITEGQKILTYENKTEVFKEVKDVKKEDFIYSKFSDLVTNRAPLKLLEIERELRAGRFYPTERQLYTLPILQLELIRHMLRKGKFKKLKHHYSFRPRNYEGLYFLAHILYRNRVSFLMDNGKIYIPYEESFRISPELKRNIKEFKNPRRYFGNNLGSRIKRVKEYSKEEKLYDLNVEDDHSFIANGYIVHNCHDDAIMAMGLCLYLRDKAQVQSSAMFLSEDGSVITYDREEMIRKAKADGDTFSSIDGAGKKRTFAKGSNPAGIVSSTEDFGTSNLERELQKEYNVRSLEELSWLIGG
jgi:intein/homing endonuclease